MNNKIFVYKVNGLKVAAIATCAYIAKQAIQQKYGNHPVSFYGELDDVFQVNGVADLDGEAKEVVETSDLAVQETK